MPGSIYREPFNDAVHLRRRFAPVVAAGGANYDVAWSLSVASALAAAAMAAELSAAGLAGSGAYQPQAARAGYASGSLSGGGGVQATASGARFGTGGLPAAGGLAVAGGASVAAAAALVGGCWISYLGSVGEYAATGLDARAGLDGSTTGISLAYAELASAAIGAAAQKSLKAGSGIVAAAGISGLGRIAGAGAAPLAAWAVQQGLSASGLNASLDLPASVDHRGGLAALMRGAGALAAGAAMAALAALDHARRRLAVVFMRTWR